MRLVGGPLSGKDVTDFILSLDVGLHPPGALMAFALAGDWEIYAHDPPTELVEVPYAVTAGEIYWSPVAAYVLDRDRYVHAPDYWCETRPGDQYYIEGRRLLRRVA